MDGYLKQSTASQTRWIGPFLDDTDFKTAETGLTIANTDIKVSKNGGASASKNSGGGTHDINGMYAVTWDATDTATVGELKYSVKVAGALQVFGSYVVLEEAIYDALFAASANAFTGAAGSTTLTALADNGITAAKIASDAITSAKIADNAIAAAKIASDAITAAKIADGAIDAGAFAADAITAAKVAADVGTEIAAAVWNALTSGLTTVDSVGKLVVDNVNATISSRLASSAITLSSGKVTVGTNEDKTGYTASTVSDKTGYSLAADQSTVTIGTVNSANVKKINDTTLTGNGSGTPWGPA